MLSQIEDKNLPTGFTELNENTNYKDNEDWVMFEEIHLHKYKTPEKGRLCIWGFQNIRQ